MSESEIQYIIWLSKRLVHKYGEDPKIISTIHDILVKNKNIISSYKTILSNIDQYLDSCNKKISFSESVINSTSNNNNNTIQAIQAYNSSFENLDVEKLFE